MLGAGQPPSTFTHLQEAPLSASLHCPRHLPTFWAHGPGCDLGDGTREGPWDSGGWLPGRGQTGWETAASRWWEDAEVRGVSPTELGHVPPHSSEAPQVVGGRPGKAQRAGSGQWARGARVMLNPFLVSGPQSDAWGWSVPANLRPQRVRAGLGLRGALTLHPRTSLLLEARILCLA